MVMAMEMEMLMVMVMVMVMGRLVEGHPTENMEEI
jgi:hypothetical protein